MKQTQSQILDVLRLESNRTNKMYAAKLSSIFALFNELEKMPGFAVKIGEVMGNCELVAKLPEIIEPDDYRLRSQYYDKVNAQNNCKAIFGNFLQWVNIDMLHSGGKYSFPFPTDNTYYNTFCGMAGIDFLPQVKETAKVLNSIAIESEVFKTLSKAIKFTSWDDLRPAMQHVCLYIEDYTCQVIATDAHKMFYSKKYECSQSSKIELLLTENDCKKIAKMKFTDSITEIEILEGGKLQIGGEVFTCGEDMHYPNFKAAIPEYKNFMQFDKDKFAANVKKVLPYANKSTGQVSFHLNGSIALKAQDVDFSFECDADMPYLNKGFKDTDIAFNGNFLLTSLSIFKDKNVKMYTDGHSSKAAIFSNDVDSVLLMPLML